MGVAAAIKKRVGGVAAPKGPRCDNAPDCNHGHHGHSQPGGRGPRAPSQPLSTCSGCARAWCLPCVQAYVNQGFGAACAHCGVFVCLACVDVAREQLALAVHEPPEAISPDEIVCVKCCPPMPASMRGSSSAQEACAASAAAAAAAANISRIMIHMTDGIAQELKFWKSLAHALQETNGKRDGLGGECGRGNVLFLYVIKRNPSPFLHGRFPLMGPFSTNISTNITGRCMCN